MNEIKIGNVLSYELFKTGFYLYGRNSTGGCLDANTNGNKPVINSAHDKPLLFGQDSFYSCKKTLDFDSYYKFCINKDWKNSLIYNITDYIKLIGKYGASDINYKNVNINFIIGLG